ncbi:MAG: NAD-dependent epimerase/dehydratase family protein [Candidatus Aegiribacteria sp.]|nr:NAD-dependent epimerase/dehydratase family protein [Candidatus Aegiribacteria sp.]
MTAGTGRILVTGALGQIGSELTAELRKRFGAENVVASDIKDVQDNGVVQGGPWTLLDVTDPEAVESVIKGNSIDTVFHMAAILSATGENNPQLCWDVNMNGTLNVLETARRNELSKVIVPSSIAAFGPETPRQNTPQETVLKPKTMYGVTKVSGELVGDYYVKKYGLDVRGLRYPGIISSETLPGGGTTDYAVDIYYKAVQEGRYTCFVRKDTMLPMMYMPDCIKATLDLADADFEGLTHHCDFNVGALSVTAEDIALSIKKHIPDFQVEYEPDYRQGIADTWPQSVDDSAAREEWGWSPDWDLDSMTKDMLEKLRKKL